MSHQKFEVLYVCTGNICRSPMAERLTSARVDGTALHVTSAGTRALVGYGMDAPSATVLRDFGGDPDGHVAQQLTAPIVTSADLVITATAEQRSTVLRQAPSAMRRVFTLREFARLAAQAPPADVLRPRPLPMHDRLAQRVAEVAGQRGMSGAGPGGDDIADPFGAALPEVQRVGQQISDAVWSVVSGLGLTA